MQSEKSVKTTKTFQEILGLLPHLVKDVEKSERKLNNQGYSRRVYVRTLFAMIEGVIYAMKQVLFVIARSSSKISKLKIPDLVVLKESTFYLNDKGEIKEKEKHYRTSENLKFTARMVNKVLGTNINLGIGTQNWLNFRKALKIRNNVTHPKNRNDLEISEEDLQCIHCVNLWFNEIVQVIMVSLKNFDWSKNVKSNKTPPN
jgi:hypothetical protein